MQLDLRSVSAKFLSWVKDFPNGSGYPDSELLQRNSAEGETTRDENGLQQGHNGR
jgi:hypothetical protein